MIYANKFKEKKMNIMYFNYNFVVKVVKSTKINMFPLPHIFL